MCSWTKLLAIFEVERCELGLVCSCPGTDIHWAHFLFGHHWLSQGGYLRWLALRHWTCLVGMTGVRSLLMLKEDRNARAAPRHIKSIIFLEARPGSCALYTRLGLSS